MLGEVLAYMLGRSSGREAGRRDAERYHAATDRDERSAERLRLDGLYRLAAWVVIFCIFVAVVSVL